MKEILKEIAQGVFTHSHWEDEEGNVVLPEPAPAPDPTDAQLNTALLLDLYAALEAKGVI